MKFIGIGLYLPTYPWRYLSWGTETVLADLIITEIHWHWVVLAYLPLEIFIFGKGSEIVSCLTKRVKHQLRQGETILDLLYA